MFQVPLSGLRSLVGMASSCTRARVQLASLCVQFSITFACQPLTHRTLPVDDVSDLRIAHLPAGIAHMMGSLKEELRAADSSVSVHTISPGMVLTGAPFILHACPVPAASLSLQLWQTLWTRSAHV